MKKKEFIPTDEITELIAKYDDIQIEYAAKIEELELKGYLNPPNAKKIEKDLFEIRLIKRNIRIFYTYDPNEDIIYGIGAIEKKTQKLATKEKRILKKRLKDLKKSLKY